MAKVLRCRDVGVDCDFIARGATTKEVLEKAKDHACSKVVAAIRDEGAATA
jgi:predicted small metal-binding protein